MRRRLAVFMVWWQAQFQRQEVSARPCSIASNNQLPARQESYRKSKHFERQQKDYTVFAVVV